MDSRKAWWQQGKILQNERTRTHKLFQPSRDKRKEKKRGGGGHMGERTTIPTKGDDKICFSYWSSVR